jgi:hypothetical protein
MPSATYILIYYFVICLHFDSLIDILGSMHKSKHLLIRCDQLKNKSSRRVTYGNPCYSIGSKANSIYFLNDRSVLYVCLFLSNIVHVFIQVSQKCRTNGALRCTRDYRKRQKNVKKILLDLFSDLAVFECGT